MNLKDLKLRFIATIEGAQDPDESIALFNIAVDKLLDGNNLSLTTVKDYEVEQSLADQFISIAKELKTGKPIQYIFGEAYFYGLKFFVNPAVLIPRTETEELVHLIFQTLKNSPDQHKKVLDIGTGSGCIPVTLKKSLNILDVSAVEISPEAIQVALNNATFHKVAVQFIEADILNYSSLDKYDIIVSNPPYIKIDEMPAMHKNVLEHEPHLALFVSNEDPLKFYKAIAAFSQTNLNANGMLYFEINEYLGEEMFLMLNEYGFRNIEIHKDMQGKDRMVSCQYH
jgi:release factor glutamine methyltransferase